MGFLSTLSGIIGFGMGLPLGLFTGFFIFVYSKPKDVKEPVISPLVEADTSVLQGLIPDMPNWVKCPDYERVDWLNMLLMYMWPYLDTAVSDMIRTTAEPYFEDYIGRYSIQKIEFENLSLGTLPLTFHGMKVYETNQNQLVMEPSIKWAGNPNIVLSVKLMSVQIKLQLVDLQVFATPRIHFKHLVPTFPCFSNIVVSLMEKPHVDFGLHVLGGDIMAIPGLYRFVQESIKQQVADLYHWPQSLEIPVLETSTATRRRPVGILHVKVVRAMKLLKADLLGTSDPYVKLKLSGEKLPSKKTSTKIKNLNPEWNETFKLLVKDPEMQTLELHVYDWDKVCHDKLGMQLVPLKQLVPNETKEFTLDLIKDSRIQAKHSKKNRGQLVVELSYEQFKLGNESFKGSFSRKESNTEGTVDGDAPHDEPLSEGGVLLVSIIEAHDVEGEHHTNPYAQILFRGEKRKTKKVKKNRNPRWDEEFNFVIEESPLNEKLHIEVFSKHRTVGFARKESLGFVEISLADVLHSGRINEKYNLINSKNGIIHVAMELQTT